MDYDRWNRDKDLDDIKDYTKSCETSNFSCSRYSEDETGEVRDEAEGDKEKCIEVDNTIPAMLEMTVAGGIARNDYKHLKEFLNNFNVYPVQRDTDDSIYGDEEKEEHTLDTLRNIAKKHQGRTKEQARETKERWEYQKLMKVNIDE